MAKAESVQRQQVDELTDPGFGVVRMRAGAERGVFVVVPVRYEWDDPAGFTRSSGGDEPVTFPLRAVSEGSSPGSHGRN